MVQVVLEHQRARDFAGTTTGDHLFGAGIFGSLSHTTGAPVTDDTGTGGQVHYEIA